MKKLDHRYNIDYMYLYLYFISCSRADVHENFRKRVEAVCVQYNQDKKMLTVLVGYG